MKHALTPVLLVGLIALIVGGPGTAGAADAGRFVIEMEYLYSYYTGQTTGTFTLSGAHVDSGSASILSSTANVDGSYTEIHELTGANGTIRLEVEPGADYYAFWYTVTRIGTFTVLSGTGSYSSLQGTGESLVSSTSGGGWGPPSPVTGTAVYRLDSDPPPNTAPTAVLLGGAGYGTLSVNLGAYTSYDQDGIIVKFEWDLDNDGTFELDTGTVGATTVTVAAAGTYTFGVRVTDNDGATDTEYAQITVYSPPTVKITAPADGSTVSGTSVRLAATATGADFVRFYVGSVLVGTDSASPYEITWDSTSRTNGSYTVMAQAVGPDMQLATDSVTVTVSNGPPPPPPLSVSAIQPSSMKAGTRINVTVTGTGFASGASLKFVGGEGATPIASAVSVVNATTITARVKAGRKGPKGDRVWDVVVTLPDGRKATLTDGFTVVR